MCALRKVRGIVRVDRRVSLDRVRYRWYHDCHLSKVQWQQVKFTTAGTQSVSFARTQDVLNNLKQRASVSVWTGSSNGSSQFGSV